MGLKKTKTFTQVLLCYVPVINFQVRRFQVNQSRFIGTMQLFPRVKCSSRHAIFHGYLQSLSTCILMRRTRTFIDKDSNLSSVKGRLMDLISGFGQSINVAQEHARLVVPITVFVAVLCLCLVVGHLLEESRWVNESITAILIGGISGTCILVLSKGKSSHILRFNEELFFIYLLPPIIFNAGFQVKKKQFFQNFVTIMLFGVVGVFISTFIITAGSMWAFPKLGFLGLTVRDYLAVGTIFSSTDTVCTLQVLHQDETPVLYSLVFGEGVVNDATSVVLFNAIQKMDVTKPDMHRGLLVIGDFLYLFSTSTGLGVLVGLVTAYVLKALYFGRQALATLPEIVFRVAYELSSIRELSIMVLMAYLSYALAELLELSGILTVFFCGILMSHYAWYNVTESSKITTRHVFAMMSFIAETFIFLYVGMDALDIEKWKMNKMSFQTSMGIYSLLVFLILIGRAAFVFPLSAASNLMNKQRTRPLTLKHQIIIWWAGLIRGAVSIALAFKQFTYSGVTWDPVYATMITNTIIVVLFTTLVFGFLTKPLVSYLIPHTVNDRTNHQEPKSPKEDASLPLLSLQESLASNIELAKSSLALFVERPAYTIHYYWRKFDNAYMRPIFGGPISNRSEC